jgi:hypothetical protein
VHAHVGRIDDPTLYHLQGAPAVRLPILQYDLRQEEEVEEVDTTGAEEGKCYIRCLLPYAQHRHFQILTLVHSNRALFGGGGGGSGFSGNCKGVIISETGTIESTMMELYALRLDWTSCDSSARHACNLSHHTYDSRHTGSNGNSKNSSRSGGASMVGISYHSSLSLILFCFPRV